MLKGWAKLHGKSGEKECGWLYLFVRFMFCCFAIFVGYCGELSAMAFITM